MAKTTFTSKHEGQIKISSTLSNMNMRFPNTDDKDQTVHNEFKITVSKNGARTSYKYYMSQADYERGIIEMENRDMIYALKSFVDDAISGEMDFREFCSGFGYDEDSRRAEKIWKACRKSNETAKRLFSNLYELGNDLREWEEKL